MPVVFPDGYALPSGARPLTHARIAHAGNWITGTVSASSTAAPAIYTADAPANSALFERWKPATVPATWGVTTAEPVTVDYCVIGAHDLAATGGAVGVQYFDGAEWVEIASVAAVQSGDVLFLMFAPVVASAFRIAVRDAVSSFGLIRFGAALQMEERTRYPGRTPFDLARRAMTTGNRSVEGAFLSRLTVRSGMSLTFSWSHLSESFTTSDLAGFLDAIETDLFVIADRPGTHPNDVAICWTSGDRPVPRASGAMDLHDLDLQAEGYVAND